MAALSFAGGAYNSVFPVWLVRAKHQQRNKANNKQQTNECQTNKEKQKQTNIYKTKGAGKFNCGWLLAAGGSGCAIKWLLSVLTHKVYTANLWL